MSSCVIEEIDPASDPTRYDDQLERILIDHQGDGKKFLASVFDFLDRKSRFFNDPNVSKTLARLLSSGARLHNLRRQPQAPL
jgi:hypothetical protein